MDAYSQLNDEVNKLGERVEEIQKWEALLRNGDPKQFWQEKNFDTRQIHKQQCEARKTRMRERKMMMMMMPSPSMAEQAKMQSFLRAGESMRAVALVPARATETCKEVSGGEQRP